MLPGRSLPPVNPEWRDASLLLEQCMAITEDLGGKRKRIQSRCTCAGYLGYPFGKSGLSCTMEQAFFSKYVRYEYNLRGSFCAIL